MKQELLEVIKTTTSELVNISLNILCDDKEKALEQIGTLGLWLMTVTEKIETEKEEVKPMACGKKRKVKKGK